MGEENRPPIKRQVGPPGGGQLPQEVVAQLLEAAQRYEREHRGEEVVVQDGADIVKEETKKPGHVGLKRVVSGAIGGAAGLALGLGIITGQGGEPPRVITGVGEEGTAPVAAAAPTEPPTPLPAETPLPSLPTAGVTGEPTGVAPAGTPTPDQAATAAAEEAARKKAEEEAATATAQASPTPSATPIPPVEAPTATAPATEAPNLTPEQEQAEAKKLFSQRTGIYFHDVRDIFIKYPGQQAFIIQTRAQVEDTLARVKQGVMISGVKGVGYELGSKAFTKETFGYSIYDGVTGFILNEEGGGAYSLSRIENDKIDNAKIRGDGGIFLLFTQRPSDEQIKAKIDELLKERAQALVAANMDIRPDIRNLSTPMRGAGKMGMPTDTSGARALVLEPMPRKPLEVAQGRISNPALIRTSGGWQSRGRA